VIVVGVRVAVVDGLLLALIESLVVVVEDAVVDIPPLIMVVVDESSPSVTDVYKYDGFIFDDEGILCIVDIGVLKASTAAL
jgi:hypothetical protein